MCQNVEGILLQTSEGFLPTKLIIQLLKIHFFYFPLAWNANAISVLRQLSVDGNKRRKGTACLLVTAGKHSGMASRTGCCTTFHYKENSPSKLRILRQHGTVNTHHSSLRSPFTGPSFSPRKKSQYKWEKFSTERSANQAHKLRIDDKSQHHLRNLLFYNSSY